MISVELAQNVALLVVLCAVYSYISRRWKRETLTGQILAGLLFGIAAIVGMMTPLTLMPGVIFDGRSIVVSIAGLFGGGVPAVISAAIASAYRLALGGSGALTGCGVIVTSAALGAGYHYLRGRDTADIGTSRLLGLGLVVHVAMLLWMLTLPGDVRWEVLRKITIPVLLIYPAGTVLAGWLLADEERRSRVEEALREGEEKYRTILEHIQEGYYEVDTAGNFTFFNDALCRLLGYPEDELMGMNNRQYMDEQSARKVYQTFNAVYRTGEPAEAFDWQIIRKDGTRRFVEASVSPMPDARGEPAGFRGIVRDITERKRAAEALRDERDLIDTLIQSSPAFFVAIGPDGKTWMMNQTMLQMLGYSREEVVDIDYLTTFVPQDEHQAVSDVFERLVESGQTTVNENRVLTKDGRELLVEWHGRPVFDEGGDVDYFFRLGIDITERVRSEQEQARAEKQLRRQERLAAVGRLAGGIAHDFNNILAVVVLYAEMLEPGPNLSPRQRKQLATISQQAQRATELVRQILDFGRHSMLDRRPMNLAASVKEVVKLLERTLEENVRIDLAYGDDEYPVNADPTSMQQVLMNLATNARDAMPDGGELRIRLDHVRIAPAEFPPLPEMEPGDWVRLTVSDTGTGIRPHDLSHVFEPFFTTKEVGEGSGLGLAQVYGIVKQHEGHIDLESEVGRGTTVSVYLPALPISPPEGLEQAAEALREGRGETILLVEDDTAAREALSDALTDLNYRVLEAAGGEEALSIFDEHRDDIELVLSDQVMPEIKGAELVRQLRDTAPALKAVIITGYAVDEDVQDLRAAGALDVIQKPVGVDALADAIRSALNRG